ncbi:MAG: phosphatase PAP2 family protein [Alphaproteobacteria bacterium]|nr:phosphatase PAP2 family protein [Alphaproteobacteria bacterium]
MRQLLLFILLVWAAPAFAFEAVEPRYLDPEIISPQLLPPPAKEGSKEWKQQVAMVVAAQQHISKSDKIAMAFEQKASVAMVTNALGKDFDAQHYPKTFAFLTQVMNDTAIVTETAKQFWGTRRPYVAAPKQVKLLIEPVKNNAYPSGHTSISYTLSVVLGLLYPDERRLLRAKADSVAQHRIMAGVHYPEDIEGGKKLGAIVLGSMLQNSDFQDDLNEAKEEIKSHEQ